MAVYENSDLLGSGPVTLSTYASTQASAAGRSDPSSETADTMPERRASEQLWRDEYEGESASAGQNVHVEISADNRIVHSKRLSMEPECLATLPSISSPKRSFNKPQFRIVLPSATAISGIYHDNPIGHSLPLINHRILTPPEEVHQPSWRHHLGSHHDNTAIELTPPLDMEQHESDFLSSELSTVDVEAASIADATMESSDVLAASIQLAVEKLIVGSAYPRTIRAIHQLVPSPISTDDETNPISVLKPTLTQLQPHDSASQNWVLVTHAIPEKYPMKNITGSAATTPQGLLGSSSGQDYFSVQRIVHNAIVLSDRHDLASSYSLTGPPSPALASPPCSIDISLYQRIIPPASAKEVRDLFETGAPSALADRLTELVPSGRLIFVYPTQIGARTFERDYLDKALAPITRSIVFGKGLPAEACSALSNSGAAAEVPDFDTMKGQVTSLLAGMASTEGSGSRSSWSILSSGTQGITLPHKVWHEWWSQQETPRIRAIMDHYFRQVSRQRGFYRDERFTANELARQIVQDLAQRADAVYTPPPIEVAVFVIERNS